jgi:membrane-associated phospholipid phosphatase
MTLTFLFFIFCTIVIEAQDYKTNLNYLSLFRYNLQFRSILKSDIPAFNNNYILSKSNISDASSTATPDLNLFGNLGNNILDSFKGKNIYFHLAGIASTYLLVNGDVDYHVEKFFNEHPEYGTYARPILYTGTFLPFAVGGILFMYAKGEKDNEVLGASFAVLQASLIEFIYNSSLKAITGRPNPHWQDGSDMESLSKTFRFGFLRGGVFWGWPSGHTSTTMAVVSALTNYYPDKLWLKIAGYSLVGYTMFGVSSVNRGGMHWFSDAVGGALMAYAIGSTVGKYYRKVYSGKNTADTGSTAMLASPSLNPLGINLSFQL